MATRIRGGNPAVENEDKRITNEEFLDRLGVTAYFKDALALVLENRPDHPLLFLSDYFRHVVEGGNALHRAHRYLVLSSPLGASFDDNLASAFRTLDARKSGSSIGLTGGDMRRLIDLILTDPAGVHGYHESTLAVDQQHHGSNGIHGSKRNSSLDSSIDSSSSSSSSSLPSSSMDLLVNNESKHARIAKTFSKAIENAARKKIHEMYAFSEDEVVSFPRFQVAVKGCVTLRDTMRHAREAFESIDASGGDDIDVAATENMKFEAYLQRATIAQIVKLSTVGRSLIPEEAEAILVEELAVIIDTNPPDLPVLSYPEFMIAVIEKIIGGPLP